MYDMMEPCSDSGAYVAEPKEKTKISTEEVECKLKELGYIVEFSSEVILLVEHPKSGIQVGVYPSGKLLFKTSDNEIAKKLFSEIEPIIISLSH